MLPGPRMTVVKGGVSGLSAVVVGMGVILPGRLE
jgi:hypothetical protein